LTTREPIQILYGHEAPVLTVLYSFDSKLLASSDEDGYIKIWSMPNGQLIRTIKAHDELIQDLTFAADNKTIVSASLDMKVKMWDVTTGNNLYTKELDTEIWSVDIVSDGSIIILGCADSSVRFLTKKGGKKK
jgi:WD40 repeat protein